MRYFALLPFFFLTLPFQQVVAQNHHGPRLGLGLATQCVGGLFQNTSDLMPAPVFGWGYEAVLVPQFSIVTELLWLTKGAVVRNPAQDTRSRTALHYLELPILCKIATDPAPGGIFITVGPSLGYYLSGHYKSWLGNDLVVDEDYDLASDENRFQFSLAVGLGYAWHQVDFEARAQSSLTPFSATTNVQNIVYQMVFSWRFDLKKKEEPVREEG